MKATFLTALVLGFCGVLAAAHYVPWVAHVRLPSKTSVVANGGRAEQFVIRLPVDRISATGSKTAGIRAAGKASSLPPSLAADSILVEHFKVRDADGNVVGIAARHWSADARGLGAAWSLLIPSRGALLLTSPGEQSGVLDAALAKAGYHAGEDWTGDVRVELAASKPESGAIAGGSEEFAGLAGEYTEIWTVTGVSEAGELRGTIELDTVTRHGS
jgi:hypothetical protein